MPSPQSLPTLDEFKRWRAETSLHAFVKQAWHVVEPGKPFVDGKHIHAMCLHLEAVSRGEIKRLLINIPPRSMKSLLVSVFWPCWEWINSPEKRWLFASYSDRLSVRDSMKCRHVICSKWYQDNWSGRFRLADDQNTKGRFENDKRGFRMATSIGGLGTGEGGDRLVCDDPHNVMDAFSTAAMENAVDWFKEVWSSRLNDASTGAKVVVMQRVSEKDVSAHIIDEGGWEHLCLPAEFEPERKCRTSIWEDWRTKEGELLWPERMDEKTLADLKKSLGSYGTAGQLQQSPAPRGGGMFRREWFGTVDVAPASGGFVRYWDRSYTEGGGDWTSGLKMSVVNGLFYVHDVRRFQGSAFTTENAIRCTAEADGPTVTHVLEQDPAAGKSEVAYLIRALSGHTVRAVAKRKNKELSAYPASAQAEAGNIKLVKGGWNEAFLDEIGWFPRGKHDDQVDSMSGAFNYLTAGRRLFIV